MSAEKFWRKVPLNFYQLQLTASRAKLFQPISSENESVRSTDFIDTLSL